MFEQQSQLSPKFNPVWTRRRRLGENLLLHVMAHYFNLLTAPASFMGLPSPFLFAFSPQDRFYFFLLLHLHTFFIRTGSIALSFALSLSARSFFS